MEPYDSDSDEDDGPPTMGVATHDVHDPERNARIQQMVQLSNSAFDILNDDQVTDFVLRMAEKNQQKTDSALHLQIQQQQQTPQQPSPSQQQPQRSFTIDSDEDEEQLDELDASSSRLRRQAQRKQQRQEQYQNHSPDEYPPGEAYVGDEELAEYDEYEIPSFDPKDGDLISYGRLCGIACALVIGMIAITIIILVFVMAVDGSAQKSTVNREFEGMILPTAPSNLKELCTLENLKGMEGVLECREPCMKAACCWEIGEAGGDPLCWESHPLECTPYESCVNLLHAGDNPRPQETRPTSSIPRAPQGVASCDPTSIESVEEVLLCEDACTYGACCWKDGETTCLTDPNCPEYQACEILNTGGNVAGSGSSSTSTTGSPTTTAAVVVPEPPDNLGVVCSPNSTSTVGACREFCSEATCCWKMAVSTYTGSDGGTVTESILGSCSVLPECAAYKPCHDLPEAKAHTSTTSASTTSIPQPPSDLADVCGASDGNADSYDRCFDSCQDAACCWKPATTTYKRSDGQSITESLPGSCWYRPECAPYGVCKKLPVATSSSSAGDGASTVMPASSIPEAPANLGQLCTQQSVETCRQVCDQATCCWKVATVVFDGADGESIVESVEGTCSHESECAAYSPCKELPEAVSSGAHNITQAPSNLANLCKMSDLESCANFCQGAECCWKTATTSYKVSESETVTESVQGTCTHMPECASYKSCSVLESDLFSPHSPAVDPTPAPVDPTPATDAPATTTTTTSAPVPSPITPVESTEYSESMIYDACFNHVDQPNQEKTLCEITCGAGSCCYTPGQTCAENFDCVKYEPCEKLVQDVDALNTEPTDYEIACAKTDDLSDCVSLCSKVTCCYTNDLSKACDVTNPGIICSEYSACEVIYGVGNGR